MFFFRKQDNLNAIYSAHMIEGFASSMIGVFVPIYLLALGYSLSTVLIFYIIHQIFLAITFLITGYLTARFGYKLPLILRYPFLFAYLLLLLYLDSFPASLYLIAILGGIQSALYWTPLNILFAKNAKPKTMGASIGKLFALPQLSGLVGPLLAGVIIFTLGFKVLFSLALILFIFSIIPLLRSKNIKSDFKFEFSKGIKFFKKYPKFILTEIFDNIGGETEGIIWPIFIYLSLANVIAVGMLSTFIALGAILFTLMVGHMTDKYDKRVFIRIGVFSVLAIWLVRYLSNNEIIYFATTVLVGFSLPLILVPYTAIIFNQAKKSLVDEFFVIKELPTAIGRIVIFCLALFLVGNLKLLFPIAGAAYLMFLIL